MKSTSAALSYSMISFCLLVLCILHAVDSVPLDSAEDVQPDSGSTKSTPDPSSVGNRPSLPVNQEKGPDEGNDPPPGVKGDSKQGQEPSENDQDHVHHHQDETEHDNDDNNDGDDDDDHKADDHKDDAHHHKWGYHGQYAPGNWSLVEPKCSPNQKRQSPIDIITNDSKFLSTLDSISLLRPADEPPQPVTVVNNGHSVVFKTPFSLRVLGGDLGGSFQAAGLHFHWGETSDTGSEHHIDNMPFPLEMHIVTYNEEKYDTLGDAVFGENSLAVLGVLFQVSENDNPVLTPLVEMLEKVHEPGVETTMGHLDVEKLLPDNTKEYYRYEGSLTTPPCAESVIWTVFRHTVNVSEKQLSEFRELLEETGKATKLAKNWRPPQPVHTRLIYRSFALPSNTIDRLPYERAIALRLKSASGEDNGQSKPSDSKSTGKQSASKTNGAVSTVRSQYSIGLVSGFVLSTTVRFLLAMF